MSDTAPDTFFLKLTLKDGRPVGHEFEVKESTDDDGETHSDSKPGEIETTSELNFKFVFDKFVTSMDLYQRFVPMTISIAPKIASAIAGGKITEFAKAKGSKRDDLSTDDHHVYELGMNHFREFLVHQNEIIAAMETTAQIPRVMIIGLISAYDFHLSQLLRVVINLHEEITLNSEKSIKYGDLLKYDSIQQARAALIDKEVENVIRESHVDQFKWMEKNFKIKLKEGLDIFPDFVELCERRNLFTHTGGVVSPQYIAGCAEHKVKLNELKVGSHLSVSPKYYTKAVETVYEIGVKLIYVLWRKFNALETDLADVSYNELCFELIFKGHVKIAEVLLAFSAAAVKKHGGSEVTRRMMIINHANSLRLQDKKEPAKQLLAKEDWSASGEEFKLCVAAVREDVDEVVRLMRSIGSKGNVNAENYRTWPVFRGLRIDKKVAEAFYEIFGQTLIEMEALPPDLGASIELRLSPAKRSL